MAQITDTIAATAPAGVVTDPEPAASDSLAVADSVVHDTVRFIMLEAPAHDEPLLRPDGGSYFTTTGTSWILSALLLLFVIVALRFRSNSKYLGAMFKAAFEVRERGNVFDETVREKSFIFILNILWCISAGILLFSLYRYLADRADIAWSFLSPVAEGRQPLGMVICICVAALWQLIMTCAYTIVGNVFSDTLHTRMWVGGYTAVTGLSTLILFPLALLAICYPAGTSALLWVALGGFILAKLVFIWKGFRIFFREITSWVLFLYYLCSLEIVPLIILFYATFISCATFL